MKVLHDLTAQQFRKVSENVKAVELYKAHNHSDLNKILSNAYDHSFFAINMDYLMAYDFLFITKHFVVESSPYSKFFNKTHVPIESDNFIVIQYSLQDTNVVNSVIAILSMYMLQVHRETSMGYKLAIYHEGFVGSLGRPESAVYETLTHEDYLVYLVLV